MSDRASIEDLLRDVTPQVLGAVVRRYGDFAGSEDAVQEALIAAARTWPREGVPDNPTGWLVRTASRRLVDEYRRNDARRRREDLAASWAITPAEVVPATDDSLVLFFRCCHPSLTPAASVPLTLRAVGGLTTREIAAAFLVTEATMAQRISRAKATLRAVVEPFALPADDERADRLSRVLRVPYLVFNEGYATSSGPELTRSDLSGEAVRLARILHASLPDEPETGGLLALMLLTEARRPARTDDLGELVPLAEQDRTLWTRPLIAEGVALITECLRRGPMGEFQAQAAIAAVHDQSTSHEVTDWVQILALYDRLERLTGNPMVTLNRAVALAMVDGPPAGLALLEGLNLTLGDHHRLHATRAHLHELNGNLAVARRCFLDAAARADNQREQRYLTLKAARLAVGRRHHLREDVPVATVRLARREDLEALQHIERRAGEAFRALGMDAVADDEPLSTERLADYQRAQRAWVADVGGQVVGYLLVDAVAGAAHIEQVSVDPAHARQQIGSRLIDAAAIWARDRGLAAMTLTTFALVPWNAPYYARLGFVVVPEADQSPELRAIRSAEAALGLDSWPRVAMRGELA